MSALSRSFSAAISSGSDTIRMLRTRTACWVAANRIWSASDDSTAMPPVTAFMSLRMPLVRASAMIDSVASSASTMPKASASRTPIFRLVSIWISEVGCWICRSVTVRRTPQRARRPSISSSSRPGDSAGQDDVSVQLPDEFGLDPLLGGLGVGGLRLERALHQRALGGRVELAGMAGGLDLAVDGLAVDADQDAQAGRALLALVQRIARVLGGGAALDVLHPLAVAGQRGGAGQRAERDDQGATDRGQVCNAVHAGNSSRQVRKWAGFD